MIRFLLKGILRDKSRSILPIIIIAIGSMLTVLLSGYMRGVMGDMVDMNAKFQTGHVKVMSRAYAENMNQIPNDLALLGVAEITQSLEKQFPDMNWANRIRFGGLIDAPDESGQTKGQGPAAGMAIDLFSKDSKEVQRLNIENSLVSGNIPQNPGEAIIGDDFAKKLKLKLGDDFTYFGSTMDGSMTFKNFKIAGTIKFGASAMDKGAVIVDISDAQEMLDMEDGCGEILGYFNSGAYFDEEAQEVADAFNANYVDSEDEYAPMMIQLKDQNNLASYLDYVDVYAGLFIGIFVLAMSVVLWNTGLLGGLRRYQEYGIRLALGEGKGQIYRAMILEAILIGIAGSIFGTFLGLAGTYYMQVYGIDISAYLPDSNMLMPTVLHSKFSPELLYIGFIPGLFAMVLGNMLSGYGIYKRETARLFKELEV